MRRFRPTAQKRIRMVLGLTLAMGLFAACDHYDNPVIAIIPPCDDSEAPAFEALTSDVQRVLVEDFIASVPRVCRRDLS